MLLLLLLPLQPMPPFSSSFRDGIFWLPAGKDATERLPWLLEYLAVQLVLSCGGSGEKSSRLGALGGRGNKQVRWHRSEKGIAAGGGVGGCMHSGGSRR